MTWLPPAPALRRANLDRPDEHRRFPHGEGRLVRMGPLSIGEARLQPGWRWSTDIRPIVGTRSCEIHHLHLLLEGRFAVRMDSGEEAEFGPGDVFEVPRGHDAWVVGDAPAVLLDMSGNVADFGLPASRERVLATLLLTDIVDSTPTAERLGDAAWKQVLASHHRVVRSALERYRGRELNTTGDGFLALFSSAGAAVQCAAAICRDTAELGVGVRVGVHTGEVELAEDDVAGIAVHVLARLTGLGGASEVTVSAVTRALVEGSGLAFEALGRHSLKGLDEPIEVFRLVSR